MYNSLSKCEICPRKCGVNRYVTTGYCRSGSDLKINIWQKHSGEEPFISGTKGSGTIFFSGCNLSCVFCQNYQISQLDQGRSYSIDQLSGIMLQLQNEEVYNINLVTPTHFTPQIREAVISAKQNGLNVPVIWNTNSYELPHTLQNLEGLIDIYLADLKYADDESAKKYSGAVDYFKVATQAISEMFKQVGNIELDEDGIAFKGLAIRILVLPHDLINLEKIIKWLAENIGTQLYLSLMSQYYPIWKAACYPEIARPLTDKEYDIAVELVSSYGFENCLVQDLSPSDEWTPDFVR